MKTLLTHRNLIVVLVAIVLTLTYHNVSDTRTYTHIYVDAVNGANAPTGRGSAASPYQSITFALLISERNNLPDPWHVHIRPGNYNGDAAKGNAREVFPLSLRQEMIFEGTTTAEECIIDGQHTGASLVPILHGEDTEGVTIRNLTIQNSLRTDGIGGIVLHDPTGTKETPSTLEGCIVHNNRGGGVWSNMPLTLTENTFSNNGGNGVWNSKSTAAMDNTFSANSGSGLYIEGNSTGDITENIFQNNSRPGWFVKSTLEGVVAHNTFTNNRAGHGDRGGGFEVITLVGDITDNAFTGNHGYSGGGFYVGQMKGNVTNNTFIRHTVRTNRGGGFQIGDLTGNVVHNEFTDNSPGGFAIRNLTGNVSHNTFTRNSGNGGFDISILAGKVNHNIFDSNSGARHAGRGPSNFAGAFQLGNSTNAVEVFNNIFFNNTADGTGNSVITKHATHFMNNLFMISDDLSGGVRGSHTIWVNSPGCRFHNNIFSGVKTAIYTAGTFDLPITHNLFHNIKIDFVEQAGNNLGNDLLFWELLADNATDNLEGDPLLVDPVTTRDFHLQATSPAIDAGTNAFAPADDLDGVARPVGAIVDIGPYEYGGTPIITVDPRPDDEPIVIINDKPPAETPSDEPVMQDDTETQRLREDVNGDGVVNIRDLVLVAASFGQTGESAADVNSDGVVNIVDLVLVANVLGSTAAAPFARSQRMDIVPTRAEVVQWLAQARELNLTDATSQRGIRFLEQLLLTLTPKETALLANYPNPFNPETWIPYQLANPADVTLRIHAVDGSLVRTLSLGHKGIGIYQTRNRAAYWDGKNEIGEPVASGVYFYTLTAGDFIATRKMLIRK